MPEQRTVAYDNLMQQPDVPMADQKASELVALHNLIQDIAQKKIDNCINLPRIYTMVCYGHTENNAVKAVFPQDVESTTVDGSGRITQVVCNTSKIMTFPNYSGYNPVIGQGVLILTTGGISPTGGFVIAVMGFPNVFMTGLNSELTELQGDVQENIDRIDGNVTNLNTKIEENTKNLNQSMSDLETEMNTSMSTLESTINNSVTSQLSSIKSRLSSLERTVSGWSSTINSMDSSVSDLWSCVRPDCSDGNTVFDSNNHISQSIVAELLELSQKI